MAKPETTDAVALEKTLRRFLEDAPEIDSWMYGVLSPSGRDSYARARGFAADVLEDITRER
jgi:hypothetical protein